jgi:hypothetical protein
MADTMYRYTKAENCPIPTPALPHVDKLRTGLKGREPGSSLFKGKVRRGMGVGDATRTANHA